MKTTACTLLSVVLMLAASCVSQAAQLEPDQQRETKPRETEPVDDKNQPKLTSLISKLDAGKQVTIVALGDSNTELTFHTRGRLTATGLLKVALFQKYGNNKVIMINAGRCGEGPAGGLERLDRDVLRFSPDLVIICYRVGQIDELAKIVEKIQASSDDVEILLRTPNPAIATNPAIAPGGVPGKELPGRGLSKFVGQIIELGRKTGCPVVDHYNAWLAEAEKPYTGRPVANPNAVWLRMSDSIHPGPLGHLVFFREMAPYFDLPQRLPWE